MESKNETEKSTGEKRIPMRELERSTGFSRMTINFYIKEGLLPEPEKTAKNMAYYNQEFIDRLKLIEKLKSQYHLSLAQIKEFLDRGKENFDITLFMDVRDRMFHQVAEDYSNEYITWEQLQEKSGLEEPDLEQLFERGLIFPAPWEKQEEKGQLHFHQDSLLIIDIINRMLKWGMSLDELDQIKDKLAQIAKFQVHSYLEHTSPLNIENPENINADYVRSLREKINLASSFVSLCYLHSIYNSIEMDDLFAYLSPLYSEH